MSVSKTEGRRFEPFCFCKINGVCSSVGRAPDCGSGGHRFETCQTPNNVRMPEWSKGAVCKTVFRRFESDSSLLTEGSSSKEIRTGASVYYPKFRIAINLFLTRFKTLPVACSSGCPSAFANKSTALSISLTSSFVRGSSVIE